MRMNASYQEYTNSSHYYVTQRMRFDSLIKSGNKMRCSLTTILLTLFSLTGTYMYIGAGWVALDNTLDLFEQFGPVKDMGNPALDDPPEYWINPNTGNWEAISFNQRGNLVPQVFRGVQYYLIALGIFMTINAIACLIDSVRSKKAVNNRGYQGKRTGLSSISCTGWLAGYSTFLVAMWLVMVGFGVLPLLEWVITMQRCWDLDDPRRSSGTDQFICVDLVQYGLVFFRETAGNSYGLICGPGGGYDPARGNLEGLCNSYYPTFTLYLVSFIGACIALLSHMFFALRHATNFVYLKVRRYENPNGPPGHSKHQPHPHHGEGFYVNSVPNPNYEANVLVIKPHHVTRDVDVDRSIRRESSDDVIEMKQRYYDDEGYRDVHDSRRYSHSSSYAPDDQVPPYSRDLPPYQSSRSYRHSSYEKSRNRYSDDERSYERTRHHSSDYDRELNRKSHHYDSSEDQDRSATTYRSKATYKRTQGSDTDSDAPQSSRERDRRGRSKRHEYRDNNSQQRYSKKSNRSRSAL